MNIINTSKIIGLFKQEKSIFADRNFVTYAEIGSIETRF